MDKDDSGFRDALLGAKLEHIAGVVGYLFPNRHFTNRAFARELKINDAQMSRKRIGKLPVTNQELSTLLVYCGLGRLTISVFQTTTVAELDAILQREKIGIYGCCDADAIRHQWLMDLNLLKGNIEITNVNVRRGTLGLPQKAAILDRSFRVGERVRMKISVPEDGFLLVLTDDYVRREISCLMPSCFAPKTAVKKGDMSIPVKAENIEPAFTVGGPPGWSRIFAFWTKEKWRLDWLNGRDMWKDDPIELDTPRLREIAQAVGWLRDNNRPYQILAADYRVVD